MAGGSRGIGGTVSRALAAAGSEVAIGYRSREADARETAGAAALGGLDVFVMCAVDPLPRPIEALSREDFERTMRANAAPFVLGSLAAAKHMDGGGRIVGLSTTGAHHIRNPRYAPLGLAKGVIEAAVRFLAVSLAPRGITVNAVAPGPTDTEAFASMAADPEELRARLAALTPMGRVGTPEDAARLIAFLCSEDGGWVTGQLVFSDGGYSLV